MGEVDSTLVGVSASALFVFVVGESEANKFKSCGLVIMGEGFCNCCCFCPVVGSTLVTTIGFSFVVVIVAAAAAVWLERLFLLIFTDKVFLLLASEDLSLLSRNDPAPTVQHNNKDKNPPFWNGFVVVVVAVLVGFELLLSVAGKGDLTYSGSTTFFPFSILRFSLVCGIRNLC